MFDLYQSDRSNGEFSKTPLNDVMLSTMECQYGLLDYLHSVCVLTDQQHAELKSEHDSFRQNKKLLKLMTSCQTDLVSQESFVSALKATNQSHLVSYIKGNCGMCG